MSDSPPAPDPDEPGSFYLGRRHDVATGETGEEPVRYRAGDLTTHAVCVGMTGSGKTGLGMCLLEEAALEGIPALVVDPKGDMGNLALRFPHLEPEDFRPWIDPDEAARREPSAEDLAVATANAWRAGLARWGEGPERVQRLVDAADVAIFTPGSDAGIPVSVLRSFDAPHPAIAADRELLTERIQGATAGLLALLGIEADPLQSRETILIASILQETWSRGQGTDLAGLIRAIQDPPFDRLGVFDLETFYPSKDRLQLAMQINSLLASPGFALWIEGMPLDVDRLLYTPEGRPRLAVLSIAHLSDTERMSFVTMLLNEVLSWMRARPGTSSLRALLYMDEIFGFFPPTREPPAKRPMLTLLKQARAYGLGVVLATQNPVDLDYKGLSNTGTWFLGRLQTERDKERVLDGLEGAVSGSGHGFDRRAMDRILSGLGKRVFLLHDVHEEAPVVFHTRWALSYLRGPMTREEIRRRMADHPLRRSAEVEEATADGEGAPAAETAAEEEPAAADPAGGETSVDAPAAGTAPGDAGPAPTAEGERPARPVLPATVREQQQRPRRPPPAGARLLYRPALAAEARLHYARSSVGLEDWRTVGVTVPLVERLDGPDWESARFVDGGLALEDGGPAADGATLGGLPAGAGNEKLWGSWTRELRSLVYRELPARILRCKRPRLVGTLDESDEAFRARIASALREEREREGRKVERRFEARLESARERVRHAEEKLAVQQDQLGERRRSSRIQLVTSVLGALFSRRKATSANVNRAGTAARSAQRVAREKADVERAREALEARREKLRSLGVERDEALAALDAELDPDLAAVEEVLVPPRKGDLEIGDPLLLWVPFAVHGDGITEPLV